MVSTNGKDGPELFHKWCLEEMRFRPRGRHVNSRLPECADVSKLYRGQAAEIIDFLVNNVSSSQTVKKVKGNLKLKASTHRHGKSSDEKCDLSELIKKRNDLIQELNNKRAAIFHVEKDLERLKTDLTESETSFKKAVANVGHLNNKTALLTAFSSEIHSSIAEYDECKNRLRNKVTTHQERLQRTSTAQMYSKEAQKANSSGDASTGLETACTRSVRECCEHIGLFLHQLLQGKFADSADTLTSRKDMLCNVVQKTFDEYPPGQLVLSLSVYAQDSTIALRDKTSNVDIRKDVEILRFKYETNGQFTDTSSAPSVIETVSLLLGDAHRMNIQRFMETEQSKNNAWKLGERLETSRQTVVAHFNRSYRSDHVAMQLATNLLDKETQVTVCRANLRHLHSISEELKDRISRATREKEVLYSKYQRIQDFTKVVDQKQNLIRVLVKQNLNAPSKLSMQQGKIKNYIQRSMLSHQPEARNHKQELTDCVSAECNAFASLTLPYLMFITLDDTYKLAVIELSINQSKPDHGVQSTAYQALSEIQSLLEFPAFQAPEFLMRHVLRLKNEITEVERSLKHQQDLWNSDQASLLKHMDEICSEVDSHDDSQLGELLPLLQKRITMATQALSDCLNVKDTVRHWWEQPAQFVTPWMETQGLTFQQWKDRWTVLATRLRQAKVA